MNFWCGVHGCGNSSGSYAFPPLWYAMPKRGGSASNFVEILLNSSSIKFVLRGTALHEERQVAEMVRWIFGSQYCWPMSLIINMHEDARISQASGLYPQLFVTKGLQRVKLEEPHFQMGPFSVPDPGFGYTCCVHLVFRSSCGPFGSTNSGTPVAGYVV